MLETSTSALDEVQALIGDRLRAVESELAGMVPADFEAVDEVNEYLFANHGKLLRPTLLLLSSEVGGNGSRDAVKLGAIVELMHVATLVHDDAVDHSVKRRGQPTVNERWTHQVAVIMGDYLYSRAVIEIAALGDLEAVRLLASAANRMTIGEMRQLMSHDVLGFTRQDYYLLCECKTASLLSASCELGAMSGEPLFRAPLRGYGFHLGMCFQITDDLLDYTSPSDVTGKPGGQDLREHKVTLPLIAALPEMSATERSVVQELFADPEPSEEMVKAVIDVVSECGGIAVAEGEAAEVAARARDALSRVPARAPRDALEAAVDYVVGRVS